VIARCLAKQPGDRYATYAVTASHVIKDMRDGVAIRFNATNGQNTVLMPNDLQNWQLHPDCDVGRHRAHPGRAG
jgi:hypothetical protein